ncbi:tetratricopeptide repeat-containing sulfotransferase family protein [Sphingomonas jinjuensis]|uniref:tetratricopeptide repeat-containing sulfotransferase family protein n=1 Tax=Sphingomonas jinjuensis TaxID=535907 RepID=UPI001FEC6386
MLRAGRVAEAIDAYARVTALDPRAAAAWYNLGYLLRADRQFEAALHAYGRAIEAGIDRVEEVHLNRAVILSEFLERAEDAEAELTTALAIAPGFALAWLNLGNVREDRGDAHGARGAYERALAIDPASGRALARIAAIDVFEGQAAASVDRLRRVASDPRMPVQTRAEVAFALGNALDALGAYREAFQAIAAAHQMARAAMPPQYRYDRNAQAALVDRLIALPPLPRDEAPGEGPQPVFVCGMFRSGSTLVERILSRHSRITGGGEIEALPALAHAMPRYPAEVAAADAATLAGWRDAYLAEVARAHPGEVLVTDKRPDNFLHLALVKRLFPAAPIIHTVRAPMDNLVSIWFLHFDDSITYGHDLGDIVHWYAQYRRLMAHWRERFGDDIRDIAYEQVVAAPRESIGGLLASLGLPWEEGVLSERDRGGVVRTASVWQVRQPLHQRSVDRWKNYAAELAPVRDAFAAAGIATA